MSLARAAPNFPTSARKVAIVSANSADSSTVSAAVPFANSACSGFAPIPAGSFAASPPDLIDRSRL
jgi:hypothetical protein